MCFIKGYFLTGHSEKGYQLQNVKHTVQGEFCSLLFTHRYTLDQQANPSLGHFRTASWAGFNQYIAPYDKGALAGQRNKDNIELRV